MHNSNDNNTEKKCNCKKHLKRTVVIAAFLCVIMVINSFLNYLLIPFSYVAADCKNIYTNKYDTVFVGTSHGKCGINPEKYNESSGVKSVNLCLGGEYLSYTYYRVKDVCRKNSPDKIVYELDPTYWITDEHIGPDSTLLFYNMEWSSVKTEMYIDKLADKDFRLTFFPWYIFRKEYQQIKDNVSNKNTSEKKSCCYSMFKNHAQEYKDGGFVYRNPSNANDGWKGYVKWDRRKLNPETVKYFKKLVKFCKKNDVELIVIRTPVPDETLEKFKDLYDDSNEYFTNLTKEYGVKFLDFTSIKIDGLCTDYLSFCDSEGHFNGENANIFSEKLAEYIEK